MPNNFNSKSISTPIRTAILLTISASVVSALMLSALSPTLLSARRYRLPISSLLRRLTSRLIWMLLSQDLIFASRRSHTILLTCRNSRPQTTTSMFNAVFRLDIAAWYDTLKAEQAYCPVVEVCKVISALFVGLLVLGHI